MKKNIYIIIGAITVVLLAGMMFVSIGPNIQKINISSETTVKNVVLIIDSGDGSPKTDTAEFKDGMTAFDLLENQSEKAGLALKTKNYDIGVMIEAIGGVANGQGGKYWLYYVNGSMPMVAADKQVLKPGDKVEFKFEKSSF